ncbi:sorting nexin-15-like isoform X1 [Salvelinus alpinus]|uniref:sorting nexin-15-like isoform X1 n=1 Tax=Salvelinus alpinus TaxID=8036 RepID=UPI0039FD4783
MLRDIDILEDWAAIQKRRPEDVKEVLVWRRYSELKKLSYTHRNLFRRREEFPPFPRAHLFACYCSPPTSHHSPQLKDFFRCGEVVRPLDPSLPSPSAEAQTELAEEEGTVAPIQPQDLGLSLGTDLGEPEVAAEAYSEMGGSPTPVEETELPDELENRVPSQFQPCVLGTDQSQSQGPPTVPGLWAICDSYKDIVRLIYLPEVFYNVLI